MIELTSAVAHLMASQKPSHASSVSALTRVAESPSNVIEILKAVAVLAKGKELCLIELLDQVSAAHMLVAGAALAATSSAGSLEELLEAATEEINQDSDSRGAFARRAGLLAGSGRYLDAERDLAWWRFLGLGRRPATDEGRASAHILRASQLTIEGREDAAHDELQAAAATDAPAAHFALGATAALRGDVDSAAGHFARSSSAVPLEFEALQTGMTAMVTEDWDTVLAAAGHLNAQHPHLPFGRHLLALRYFVHLGDVRRALALQREAVQMAEHVGHGWRWLARMQAQAGHSEEAVESYSRALQLEPEIPWAWKERAALYRQIGDPSAADADMVQFEKLTLGDLSWLHDAGDAGDLPE